MNKLTTIRYAIFALVAIAVGSLLTTTSSSAATEQLNLASSYYRDNDVRWIAPDQYPRNRSVANWPLRSDRCSPVSGYQLKTLYIQPAYSHFTQASAPSPIQDPYPGSPSGHDLPLVSGNNAHWSSQCQGTNIVPASHKANLTWAFDAGTETLGVSPGGVALQTPGPWIYPESYGGWAFVGYSASGWSQAVRTSPAPADSPVHSGKLAQHEEGGSRCPCGEDYIVWSSNTRNNTNWFGTMVNNARSPFVPTSNPVRPGNDFGLFSNGSTLYRNEFDLTKEQYDRIKDAEENGNDDEGLFLDINADDFYHAYVNGNPVLGSPTTSHFQAVRVDADYLRVGQNAIAIQVTDKIIARATANPADYRAAGLWYNLHGKVPEKTINLVPTVTADRSLVTPGESVTFSYSVRNDSIGTAPSTSYTVSYNQSGVPGAAECVRVGSLGPIDGPTPLPNCPTETIEVVSSWGSQICARLTIDEARGPGSHAAWDEVCVTIAKYPSVHISGGDVMVRWAGSQVHTVSNQISGRQYGSWAEYSIFAADSVQSISGGALPASGNSPLDPQDGTRLTFANTPESGKFAGGSAIERDNPLSRDNGVWRNWSQRSIGANVSLSDLHPNRINQRTTGSINLTGNWSGVDDSYVIYSSANVTISSNITYTGSAKTSIDRLPQLIIIARNIYIDESVDRVDAWLVANLMVRTCNRSDLGSSYYVNLTTDKCNRRLTINGPIQAQGIWLSRTAGAEGSNPNQLRSPAEVLNFRSDAHLWAYGQAQKSQSIRTETVKDLPPRF